MSFNAFVQKASSVINSLRGNQNDLVGKEGDIVYSKNNVCVHTTCASVEGSSSRPTSPQPGQVSTDKIHQPGYLSLHCQSDDELGVTLILQWLPNTTLTANPRSVRSISPRRTSMTIKRGDYGIDAPTIHMDGDNITVTTGDAQSRPLPQLSLNLVGQPDGSTPNISVIPNTPLDPTAVPMTPGELPPIGHWGDIGVSVNDTTPTTALTPGDQLDQDLQNMTRRLSLLGDHPSGASMSPPTSYGCDSDFDQSLTDVEDVLPEPCSPTWLLDDESTKQRSGMFLSHAEDNAATFGKTTEQLAEERNLMLPTSVSAGKQVTVTTSTARFSRSPPPVTLFSVDLGRMRSLRLFYSDAPACTCGQLVIASKESQYKILHFHHGGLDKLAEIFEKWRAVRAKSLNPSSPSATFHADKHFAVCRADVLSGELDPEEGRYEIVDLTTWQSYCKPNGSIVDSAALCKAIYFAGVSPELRSEAWPFLLRVYPWLSTEEQRVTIRQDIYISYNTIRTKRVKDPKLMIGAVTAASVEAMIQNDVVRTDRRNPYYTGDHNSNLETMKNILLNYAIFKPSIGYIQGMSDMLAPILAALDDESLAFWCFAGLVQRVVFVCAPNDAHCIDKNIEYLQNLLKRMSPKFFEHVESLGRDALQLMFTHRWILLCFKREFHEADVLAIWESCWSEYRTRHFHLFVCVAIIVAYGDDCVEQKLSHDEILLYFSSLAKHMDAKEVMKKARGLLYTFCRSERLPCSLKDLRSSLTCGDGHAHQPDMWDASHAPAIYCDFSQSGDATCSRCTEK